MTKYVGSFLSHCIFLSSDQPLFSSLIYNLLFFLSFLSFIRLLLLPLILLYQPVVSIHSHDGLLSLFPSHSSMFYSFPLLSFFSWSMHAGLTYINSIVTVCILHSQSTQYKYISSLISQAILSPLEASCFTSCLKSL